jgi:hypothetical protein
VGAIGLEGFAVGGEGRFDGGHGSAEESMAA